MNCNDARKNIIPYINEQLHMDDTLQFIKHVNECSECKDELEIYYILEHGLSDREEDVSFDFQKSLNEQLEREEKELESEQILLSYYKIVYNTAVAAMIAMVGLFLLRYMI